MDTLEEDIADELLRRIRDWARTKPPLSIPTSKDLHRLCEGLKNPGFSQGRLRFEALRIASYEVLRRTQSWTEHQR